MMYRYYNRPMSQMEVFKPANGQPLFIRDNLSESNPEKGIYPPRSNSRPSTQSNSRFGQLSLASFFTRHNPHPSRVRHIKGLLDSPICSVVDDEFPGTNYKLNFPPNNFNEAKLKTVPGNVINVNSRLYPLNTITGLQNYPFKEKADPNFGIVPVTEAWREELKYLTDAALIPHPKVNDERPGSQQKKSMYSEKTGRLVPPPSRAMSRGCSRGQSRSRRGDPLMEHIVEEDDMQTKIFSMLFQILGASSISDVKQWLCSAPSAEKELMLNKIRSVILENPPVEYLVEENHRSAPGTGYQDNTTQTLAAVQEEKNVDRVVERLSIVDGQYTKERVPASRERNENTTINDILRKSQVSPLPDIHQKPVADEKRPPTSQVFQPRPSSKGPVTSANGGTRLPPASPQTMSQPAFPTNEEPRLRYTSPGLKSEMSKAWYPSDSMAI